ncbi:hypothetical protein [Limosilactobacillus reuteri]|uniref:hypothetical protein n=1 Tax=Limosilactobacillus reuteri TaxID=1598 RepID=UPI001E431A3D|nr:hypothetical protein [Limosilactobacillus reuteri]MCC4518091.1 hypothetical protein [Limosilactobacillus reuteri]MCC4518109.1 hypothetical protein [Limosilactobacillus reuteri]
MSEFKLPHVEDLDTNSYLIRQLTENFKAIEQEDKNDDQALADEIADRKKGDGNLQGQISKLQERCQKLEDQVKQLRKDNDNHEERLKKIERLLFGSQSINATTISTNESDHQGYEIADIPPYDYTEQEIN